MRPFAALLTLAPLMLAACSAPAPSPAATEMRIADPSGILGDYDLRRDEDAHLEVRAQGVSEARWREIIRLADESTWPPAIRSPDGRRRLRDEIRRYRAFRVATFGTRVILFVPARQGNDVPASMQGSAFYLIVGQRDVRAVGVVG